ncbi:DUF2304 domain-containing protein [Candidatus Borrarchaeum sp.]|uniref:DUF2304 domain-containing protein n=1 Tax=Candidatus Borrarchaeum sp. TaxID=2846742 RepID=UPI00257C12C2|nr:DUF2304 domain-containing protein [Candidatus Borrarchaeum sp.]
MIFPYQIVILVLVSIFIGYTLLNYKRGEISFLAMILWLLIWTFMIYTTFSFRLIGYIGQIFSAQAGLNIIVAFSTISLFFVCYVLFIQISKIRKEITQIVRYIGLKEAKRLKPESQIKKKSPQKM